VQPCALFISKHTKL